MSEFSDIEFHSIGSMNQFNEPKIAIPSPVYQETFWYVVNATLASDDSDTGDDETDDIHRTRYLRGCVCVLRSVELA